MKRSSSKPKLADVARAARVSVATVSRLMTGRAGVTPELRARVREAAAQLGFDLNGGRKSRIIAFLLSNRGVLHPFHSAVLMGAEAYCAEQDYGLLFLSLQYPTSAPPEELKLPEILLRRQIVAGVIVAGTNSQNLLDLLTWREIRWVVLGNNVVGDQPQELAGAVYFDDVGGAYDMTRYLQTLGHRRIGFVGNVHLPWYARRYQGYRRAMEEAGLEPLRSELNSGEGEEMGYLATKLLLKQPSRPTAIFAGDDAAAKGGYKAARDSEVRIPTAISIAGFNDTPDATTLHPPLTSVRVFKTELGKQLAELLFERLRKLEAPPRTVTLPTEVVRRESCAPPPPERQAPSRQGRRATLGTRA